MSLKNFTNVSLEDIKQILDCQKGWVMVTEPNTKEYIFQFPLSKSPHIVIRVCSGITFSGNSRGCGKDAIRVFAFDTFNKKGYIRTKRVYRIGSWAKNLHRAVVDCFYRALDRREKESLINY